MTVSSSGGALTSDDGSDDADGQNAQQSDGQEATTTKVNSRDGVDDDAKTTVVSPPRTYTSAQTVHTVRADEASLTARVPEFDTGSVSPSVPLTPKVRTQPVVATTVATAVDTALKTVVAPILSRIFGTVPTDPATSPLGWVLLAAARRGANSVPTRRRPRR